jgi:hypothetical protein
MLTAVFATEQDAIAAFRALQEAGVSDEAITVVGDDQRAGTPRTHTGPMGDRKTSRYASEGLDAPIWKTLDATGDIRGRLAALGLRGEMLDDYEHHVERGEYIMLIDTDAPTQIEGILRDQNTRRIS